MTRRGPWNVRIGHRSEVYRGWEGYEPVTSRRFSLFALGALARRRLICPA